MAKATKAMSQALGGKAPAKKASNSAAPITSVRVSDGERERSVSVEKISNGYLVRESTYGGKGGYKSTTTYSAKAPTLDVKGPKAK